MEGGVQWDVKGWKGKMFCTPGKEEGIRFLCVELGIINRQGLASRVDFERFVRGNPFCIMMTDRGPTPIFLHDFLIMKAEQNSGGSWAGLRNIDKICQSNMSKDVAQGILEFMLHMLERKWIPLAEDRDYEDQLPMLLPPQPEEEVNRAIVEAFHNEDCSTRREPLEVERPQNMPSDQGRIEDCLSSHCEEPPSLNRTQSYDRQKERGRTRAELPSGVHGIFVNSEGHPDIKYALWKLGKYFEKYHQIEQFIQNENNIAVLKDMINPLVREAISKGNSEDRDMLLTCKRTLT